MFGSPATSNIIRAIRDGNSALVAELLREDASAVHAVSMRGESALIEAAQAGDDGVLALLVRAGSRVDATRIDGATALVVALAANRCSDASVAALIGARCDVNARPSADSEAAIDLACLHGRDAAVGLLLAAGATMTARTLPRAAASGSVSVLRRLLAAGAPVDGVASASGDFDAPLICAAARLHHDAALLLLAHGADVNVRGRFVPSPLVAAARAVVRWRRARVDAAPPVLALLLCAGAGDDGVDEDVRALCSADELRRSRDVLGAACFGVIRARAFECLVALQDAALPAWCSVTIVRCMGRNARLARLSSLWQLATTVKHFHSPSP